MTWCASTPKSKKQWQPNPGGVAAIAIAFEMEVSSEASDQDLAVLERVARACPVAKSLHPDLEQNLSFAFTRV